ncbi:hypothetical protein MUK42_31206 [Musa troglodytarum]|uniref:Uncharacterized protein n=1 Tax=Musa troglodytarum TaxID=320322 RepID=A0A9E7FG11_9LILI|nr:hypothetical protein MUK42_31206 [Musa troglodytarum]
MSRAGQALVPRRRRGGGLRVRLRHRRRDDVPSGQPSHGMTRRWRLGSRAACCRTVRRLWREARRGRDEREPNKKALFFCVLMMRRGRAKKEQHKSKPKKDLELILNPMTPSSYMMVSISN